MSWLKIKLFGGELKVKPASQLRRIEVNREIPVLNLGVVYISWWDRRTIEREERFNRTVK